MERIVLIIVFWVSWGFAAVSQVADVVYLVNPKDVERIRAHHTPPLLLAGLIAFSLITCGGFRWWISRIRSLGWRLIPFWLGLFCAMLTWMFGIYVAPEWLVFFQALGYIWMVIYFPPFLGETRPLPAPPPPLPKR